MADQKNEIIKKNEFSTRYLADVLLACYITYFESF